MKTILALLFSVALALPASAQIIVPDQPVQLGARIAVVVQVPEGADVDVQWEWADEAGIEVTGPNRALPFTTTPGLKPIACTVRTYRTLTVLVQDPEHPDDKDKAKWEKVRVPENLQQYKATFKVIGSGPAPPPDPDDPVDPDLPEPKPGSLGALVPPAARAPLAGFYSDLATAVRSGMYSSVGVFRQKHIQSVIHFQNASKLPSVAAINQPISDKLVAAVGLSDSPLDAAKTSALAAALDAIAAEFRGQ